MKKILLLVALVALLVPFCVFSQTGPGGVGNTSGLSGQPRNVLWLQGNTGVSESGGLVNSWLDQSGNGNNAIGSGATRPLFVSSDASLNNRPTISFSPSGTNNHLVIADADNLDNSTGFTSFVVFKPASVTGTQGIFSKRTGNGTDQSYVLFRNGSEITTRITGNNISGSTLVNGTPTIISSVFNGVVANPRIFQYQNGNVTVSGNGPTSIPNNASDLFLGTFDVSGGETRNIDGSIAEIIIYTSTLNAAQRQVVENYLSAKYNLTLTAGDVYAGDTPGNGNFDVDVAGIGRAGGTLHTMASSAGFELSTYNGSVDADGEFVMVGHSNITNSVISAPHASLPVGVQQRWARTWYVDKTGNVDAAITFDFSDGINGQFPQAKDNYVLLRLNGSVFEVVNIASGDKSITGDKLSFRVTNADLTDGVYTLGTTNSTVSPVNGAPNRIWYSYQTGNWDNPLTWTLDGGVTPLYVNPFNEVPLPNDNVIITTGRTVTITTNTKQASSIEVIGTLDIGTTSGHNFTSIRGSGRIRFAGSGGIDNFPAGTVTDFVNPAIGGIAEIYGFGFSLNQARTFNKLEINLTAGSVTLLANLTVNGTFDLLAGNFQINDGSSTTALTINAYGNVTVNPGAEIRTGNANARHQFNFFGDLNNNGGIVYFTNRITPGYTTQATDGIVDANFLHDTANQAITCSGETRFYRIVIDKGVDDTYILSIAASSAANFQLLGFNNQADPETAQLTSSNNSIALIYGTLEVRNNVAIPNIGNNNNFNISQGAALWVNGGVVQKDNGNALVPYGKIRVSAGTLTARVNGGITTRDNGSIIVEGGTLNTNQIRTSVFGASNIGGYIQSGGTVTVDGGGPGGAQNDYYIFSLTYPGNVFTMSGGTLIVRGARGGTDGTRGGIFINSDPANISVTGGTVIMEISNNNAFKTTSRAPFWDVTMRRTAGTGTVVQLGSGESGDNGSAGEVALAIQPLVVLNNLRIENNINFTTNNANVSIAGNMLIQNTGSYTPGTNTTEFNGLGINTITFDNTTTTKVFHNLKINKNNASDEIRIANGATTALQTQNVEIARGIFDYQNFILDVDGNIINNGSLGKSASTGRVLLSGSSAQSLSGTGTYYSVELNNASGATLASDLIIARTLTLTTGVFDINANKLTMQGAAASIANVTFGTTRMIQMAGSASDGGLEMYVDANETILFPIGTNANATVRYTPGTLQIQNFSDDGYVRMVIADQTLLTADVSAGGTSALSYYWRVNHRDFTTLPTASYRFTYADSDIDGNEANYVPGKVLDALPFTRTAEDNNDINRPSNRLTFNGTSNNEAFPGNGFTLENANYSAGNSAKFTGSARIFYNRENGETSWTDNNKWSLVGFNGASTPLSPAAGDIVMMRNTDGSSSNNSWVFMDVDVAVAAVVFDNTGGGWRPRIRIPENRNVSLGVVYGEGEIFVEFTTTQQPTIYDTDFGNFAAQTNSFFIYRADNNNVNAIPLPTTITEYPNLRIEGGNGNIDQRIVTNTVPIRINQDFWIDWASTFRVGANVTVARDLRPGQGGGNGGRFEFGQGGNYTVDVGRDLLFLNNAAVRVRVLNTTPSSLVHTLRVGRNITQNVGEFDLYNGTGTANNAILELAGSDNGVYTNPSGNTPDLFRIVMNKGTSIASTFSFDNAFALNGVTDQAIKAIELANGLLILNNNGININLSTGGGSFSIPSTAGLEVQAGTANVRGNDTGILLDGLLRISGANGNMSLDDAVNNGNNFIEYSASGNALIEITNGALTVGSHVRRSLASTAGILKYTQSGGTVRIASRAAPLTNRSVFEVLNAGSSFNHTGGSFTIVRGINSTTVPSLFLNPASSDFTGSTITIGDAATPSGVNGQNIGIRSNQRLNNLILSNASGNNPTAKIYVEAMQVIGDLTIESGTTFDAQGNTLSLRGNFLVNGTFNSNGNLTQHLTTEGSKSISGSSNVVFHQFTKRNGGTLTINTPITVSDQFSHLGGTIAENGNTITLQGNAEINSTITSTGGGRGVIFEGTSQQILSRTTVGTSTLGIVTINNPNGVVIPDGNGYNFNISTGLRLEQGVFDIGSALLTLQTNANIEEVNLFGVTNMIQTNSSFTDNGVRKIFPANSTQDFTFPVGLVSKYTPVRFDFSSGSHTTGSGTPTITVRPANERHPSILEDDETGVNDALGDPCPSIVDANNVLQYHWIITAQNVNTSFASEMTLTFIPTDAAVVAPITLEDYIAARVLEADNNVNKFSSTDVDDNNYTIRFTFNNTTQAGISGDYFAGADCAIPNVVPVYTTDVVTGNVNGDSYDIPVPGGGAPNGAVLIVNNNHTLNFNVDNVNLYRTEIRAGATLTVDGTIGHRLGTVSGQGTLRLVSNTGSIVLPAGFYNEFFSCTGGGLEFSGTGSYDILGGITSLRRLSLTGSGARTMANNDLIVCEDFIVNGPSFSNPFNRNITAQRDMIVTAGSLASGINNTIEIGRDLIVNGGTFNGQTAGDKLVLRDLLVSSGSFQVGSGGTMSVARNVNYSGGTFNAGSGTSKLVMNGSVTQTMTGNFTGAASLYTFEINNTRGVTLNGNVTIANELQLTAGNVRPGVNNLTLNSAAIVTPSSGQQSSFVDGRLRKTMATGTSFTFPVGKGNFWRPAQVINTSSGAFTWNVEYFGGSPLNEPQVDNLTPASPAILSIADGEYWKISDGNVAVSGVSARIGISWGAETSVSPNATEREAMEVMVWNDGTSRWDNFGGTDFSSGHSQARGSFVSFSAVSFSEKIITLGSSAAANALPVEFTYFRGNHIAGVNRLTWETATEINNDRFEILRSTDNGESFEVIGTVQGSGTTTQVNRYSFDDIMPVKGVNYYRLRQVDYTGEFSYASNTVVINVDQSAMPVFVVNVYPNPTAIAEAKAVIFKENTLPVRLNVYDVSGRVLFTNDLDAVSGEPIELNLPQLPAGLYLIEFSQGFRREVKRLVIK